jgi:hypothetical protein
MVIIEDKPQNLKVEVTIVRPVPTRKTQVPLFESDWPISFM